MSFSDPVDDVFRKPVGIQVFTQPVFEFDPTEPAGGILLKEDGAPLLQENGRFISLEPLVT